MGFLMGFSLPSVWKPRRNAICQVGSGSPLRANHVFYSRQVGDSIEWKGMRGFGDLRLR